MRLDKLVMLIFAITAFALWVASRRFSWAERTYERTGTYSFAWFWLDTFHVEKTREHCIRFLRGVWTVALFLIALGTVVVLIWGQ
jgi:hypothetical protein